MSENWFTKIPSLSLLHGCGCSHSPGVNLWRNWVFEMDQFHNKPLIIIHCYSFNNLLLLCSVRHVSKPSLCFRYNNNLFSLKIRCFFFFFQNCSFTDIMIHPSYTREKVRFQNKNKKPWNEKFNFSSSSFVWYENKNKILSSLEATFKTFKAQNLKINILQISTNIPQKKKTTQIKIK